jgi:Zn-dependent protease with chaperone function
MDFFDHQERARRNTGWLIIYFALAVLGIIAVLQVVLALAMGESPLDLRLLGMIAGGVVVVVTLGSLFKILELSQGGGVVAEMLGGRQIDPHTVDAKEVQLRNVVEEMAIASGLPVPDIYLLPGEEGINAFAAGNRPGDAVVAVTRGTLDSLTRDELQGVVAHEFSHILNGDMRLNIRLIGALNGILLLAILGNILFRTGFLTGGRARSGRGSNGNGQIPLFVIGIALLVVGSIGAFFARLIKAAVSRQREFLADASAVQFTRNPDGIAGALFKIGRASSKLATPRAQEASHLFFGNGVGEAFASWFATHPPIDERIAAIAPGFDPASVRAVEPDAAGTPVAVERGTHWAAGAGTLDARSLALAATALAGLPDFSRVAARETGAAVSLVYSLLLSADDATRVRQVEGIEGGEAQRRQVLTDLERRAEIPGESWLHTVDLCLPALRKMSGEQYRVFRTNVRRLVEADGQVDLFEYVLQKALTRHLDGYFERSGEPPVRFRSVVAVLPELATLLSALAWFDAAEDDRREASFRAGVESLNLKPDAGRLERTAEMKLGAVDGALDRLAQADGPTKKKILNACGRVVMADDVIEPRQGALLRAVADTLGCPIPPFATGEKG